MQAVLGVLVVVNKARDLCSHEAERLLGDTGRRQADILSVPWVLEVLFYLCSSFRGVPCRCPTVRCIVPMWDPLPLTPLQDQGLGGHRPGLRKWQKVTQEDAKLLL